MKKKNKESKVINNATSKGNVKISFLRNGKEHKIVDFHNTGTKALCEFLRDAMTNNESVMYRRPGMIIPCKKNTTTGELVKLIDNAGPTYISTKNATGLEDNQAGLVISFKIQGDLIPANVPVSGFKLFSINSNDFKEYASIDITNIEGNDYSFVLEKDTDIKVDWTLVISYV